MQEDNRAVQVRVRACGSPFRIGPIRILADLEDMTSVWVAWYNTSNHAPSQPSQTRRPSAGFGVFSGAGDGVRPPELAFHRVEHMAGDFLCQLQLIPGQRYGRCAVGVASSAACGYRRVMSAGEVVQLSPGFGFRGQSEWSGLAKNSSPVTLARSSSTNAALDHGDAGRF